MATADAAAVADDVAAASADEEATALFARGRRPRFFGAGFATEDALLADDELLLLPLDDEAEESESDELESELSEEELELELSLLELLLLLLELEESDLDLDLDEGRRPRFRPDFFGVVAAAAPLRPALVGLDSRRRFCPRLLSLDRAAVALLSLLLR